MESLYEQINNLPPISATILSEHECALTIDKNSTGFYYIVDDTPKWYDLTTANGILNEPEPKYKLRKCECCGGPIKGLTCDWCGAEYERY